MPSGLDGVDVRASGVLPRRADMQVALETAGIGAWDLCPSRDRLVLSPGSPALLGHDEDAGTRQGRVLSWSGWLELVHPEDRQRLREAFEVPSGNGIVEVTCRLRHRNERWVTLLCRGRQVTGARNRRQPRFVGSHVDVSELLWLQHALREARQAEDLAATVDVALWRCALDQGEMQRNARWSEMFGHAEDEPDTDRIDTLAHVHSEDRVALLAQIHKAIAPGGPDGFQSEYRMRHSDGRYLWVMDRVRVTARDADGRALSLAGMMVDVTQETEARRLLEARSSTDALTGIANRGRFDERLRLAWQQAVEAAVPLAVLLIDVDFFKCYNDHYGHIAGDDCLRSLAWIMSLDLRGETDLLARFGGEEFVVLLPECGLETALEVGGRIREAVESLNIQHAARPDGVRAVSISIGVACTTTHDAQTTQDLLRLADQALYDAKTSGRNRVSTRAKRMAPVAPIALDLSPRAAAMAADLARPPSVPSLA